MQAVLTLSALLQKSWSGEGDIFVVRNDEEAWTEVCVVDVDLCRCVVKVEGCSGDRLCFPSSEDGKPRCLRYHRTRQVLLCHHPNDSQQLNSLMDLPQLKECQDSRTKIGTK